MDFRQSKLMDAYRNNAEFNQLVQVIQSMISTHGFTPSEIREAAFLAHYRYEMENPEAVNARVTLNLKAFYDSIWK